MSTFIYFSLKEALEPKEQESTVYTLSSGHRVASHFCSDKFLSEAKAKKTFKSEDVIFVGRSIDAGHKAPLDKLHAADRFPANIVYQAYLNQIEESGKDICSHLSGSVPLEYSCLLNSMAFQHQAMFDFIPEIAVKISSIKGLYDYPSPLYVRYKLFSSKYDLRDVFVSLSYKSAKDVFEMLKPCFEDWGFVKKKTAEVKEVEEVKSPEAYLPDELQTSYKNFNLSEQYLKNNPYMDKAYIDKTFGIEYPKFDMNKYEEILKKMKVEPDIF